ncbi:hypothetical protein [Chroococcidiopsis sp. SAG 2025]|uniref:hypothetical protein n=1 Tax=Chroococcidiopsis sp. SAG 2025 TaxID=171389 RepID=UPI0029373749|nr:hypothetical protein [Chroococcidiopsis sp. SAG 2025]
MHLTVQNRLTVNDLCVKAKYQFSHGRRLRDRAEIAQIQRSWRRSHYIWQRSPLATTTHYLRSTYH